MIQKRLKDEGRTNNATRSSLSRGRPRLVGAAKYYSALGAPPASLPPTVGFGFTEKRAEARYRLDSETRVRLGAFLAVFVAMALWGVIAPRRPLALGRSWRWPNNLGVPPFNAILLRVLMPGAAVAVAPACQIQYFDLFHH